MNNQPYPLTKKIRCFFAILYISIRNWNIVKSLIIYQLPQLIIGKNRALDTMASLIWAHQYHKAQNMTLEQRITKAFENMGPIFVKFGQLISTRVDILPNKIAQALETLQDDMPPYPFEEAKKIIEENLEQSLKQTFKSFDKKTIGSASLAQVYKAQLHNGKEVIIKVLRPNIATKIQKNLKTLYAFARIVDRYHPNANIIDATGVVEDYDKSIHNEIDLLIEAANCSQMYRNAMNHSDIKIPKMMWKYCRKNMLVTEFLQGIKIQKKHADLPKKVNKKQIAISILMLFLDQAFKYNFFHADMHPGNILIDIKDPKKPIVSLVDFGIVGSMTQTDQFYIAQNLLAFFNRDYERIIELHIESGWIPDMKNQQNMMSQIRSIGEPLYAKPLKDISFAKVLADLIQIAKQYKMVVQPQLFLLQKTIFNIEAIARRLDPDLNLWENAKPYVEQWISNRYSVKDSLYQITQQIPKILHNIANPKHKQAPIEISYIENKSDKQHQQSQIPYLIIGFLIGILLTKQLLA